MKYISTREQLDNWQEIDIIVSRDCLLRCKYCYLQKSKDKDYDLDSIIENLDKTLANVTSEGVVFGLYPEPWVNLDRTNEIIKRILKVLLKYPKFVSNYMFFLGTCGISLQKTIPMIENNLNHMDISVTIDGIKEQHDMYRVFENGSGSFDVVKKNILKYQEKYNLYDTKVTIGPETIRFIYETALFLWNDLNFKTINMNVLFEDVWNTEYDKLKALTMFEDQLIKLSDYIIRNNLYDHKFISLIDDNLIERSSEQFNNKIYCGAAVMRSIDSDGSVYPCFRLSPYSLNEDKKFMFDKTSIENSQTDRALKVLDMYDSSPEKCLNCNLINNCSMCVGAVYEEEKTIFSRTMHHCEFIKLQNKYAKKIKDFMETINV